MEDQPASSQENPEVERQLAVFKRGTTDLIEEKQLRGMIAKSLETGVPLRIKFGMDPSSPDLHLGHAVQLRKLRDLQDLGHKIVLIVGDATAMVGDPSGRNKLRPVLTRADVAENLKTYTTQAARVLDLSKTEVRQNAEWFDKMDFEALLKLTTRMTVAQMIERDTFQTRMEANEPIGINEFLYPLMQGWDSVIVEADLELGGTDQLFNLLVGRRLQEQESQRPQIVMTQPLINGLDGRKMSKSYGNAVGLTATAKEMTFRVMQVDDEVMPTWFLHLTRLSPEKIEAVLTGHPREAKARLAAEVTTFYHGAEAAAEAAQMFNSEVRDKALPDNIPAVAWSDAWGAALALPNFLKEAGMCQSTSEARRAIQQGGVRLDGDVKDDVAFEVTKPSAEVLVQVGKKRVKRLTP
ncbi:MAG: tyrosyl-tRNA synthetase [Planctomycetota bacterium]|jgi:tyrosyl-tRNA synthetase